MKFTGTKKDLIDRWLREAESARILAEKSPARDRLELLKQAMIWEQCAVELELWQESSD